MSIYGAGRDKREHAIDTNKQTVITNYNLIIKCKNED